MLILTRKTNERITVTVPGRLLASGEDMAIEVLVASAKFGTARLGIDAPREVSIARNEMLGVQV